MKLHELIQEGMIQLPAKLLHEAWSFVLSETLKQCYANLEHVSTATERQISAAETLLDKAAVGFDVEDFPTKLIHAPSSTKILPIEIPDRYLARYKKLRGERETKGLLNRKVNITVVYIPAGFEEMTADTLGMYYADGSVVAVQPGACKLDAEGIIAIVSSFKTLAAQAHALTLRLDKYKGTLEHELTHMLQYTVFSDFHDKQLIAFEPDNSVPKASQEAQDIYLTSPMEFDPWIKSELPNIRALLRRKQINGEAKRALVNKFVSADLHQGEVNSFSYTKNEDPERSDFFISLKRNNMKNWKLAVKLLTSKLDAKELA